MEINNLSNINRFYFIKKSNKGVDRFISLPHFLNGDKKFITDIDGLEPNAENHDYLLSLEPVNFK
jgi:hypothetical protein